ncbi:MAG: response regulator transcription factor [Christensenellaceae bacterium]|jgi:two-component system response regulator VicR
MAKRILVVDDEPNVIRGLQFSLEQQEGYQVDAAYDGGVALALFEENIYDLVLLDLMLPVMDGMAVCQQIRSTSDVPIIMLTAKGDDIDRIMGLEYGADDYLTKPFNMLELKVRIKNLFRRVDNAKTLKTLSGAAANGLSVDFINRVVLIEEEEVSLTSKEFDLLQFLISNKGIVYDRETLLNEIWKQSGDARTVDVHVRRLREKIEQDPATPEYILTKWGVGYYFADK